MVNKINRFANKLVVIFLGGGLWIYYRLGGGGKHREEIRQVLGDIKAKLFS